MLVIAVDNMFQDYYNCGFLVVKLNCGNQFEPAVEKLRVKQDPIVNANYYDAEETTIVVLLWNNH